jgi:hypothetical protein
VADNTLFFEKIENLTGTNGDDRLIGGSDFVLTGRNRGIVDDFFVFNDIENLVGTVGDDNFDLSNGFWTGPYVELCRQVRRIRIL